MLTWLRWPEWDLVYIGNVEINILVSKHLQNSCTALIVSHTNTHTQNNITQPMSNT